MSAAQQDLQTGRDSKVNSPDPDHIGSNRIELIMSSPNLIAVLRQFPKELFRVNNGSFIKLRFWTPRRHIYDLFTHNELAQPKALDPSSYSAPNGASMRPNSRYQQSLVSWRFRSDETVLYSVPKGTKLPEDLILVHERSDHYLLPPAAIMTVDSEFYSFWDIIDGRLNTGIEMNAKRTRFFEDNAQLFTRGQWLKAYPKATETSW